MATVSNILMLMNVKSLLVATIAIMVKIVSVTISMVVITALVPMVITQPTMTTPSALTNVLREHITAMLMQPVPIPMVVSNALAR